MADFIMEAVLVAALVVAVATLLYFGFTSLTPAGKRWAESRAGDVQALVCPIHGAIPAESVIRLPSGERACPKCQRGTV